MLPQPSAHRCSKATRLLQCAWFHGSKSTTFTLPSKTTAQSLKVCGKSSRTQRRSHRVPLIRTACTTPKKAPRATSMSPQRTKHKQRTLPSNATYFKSVVALSLLSLIAPLNGTRLSAQLRRSDYVHAQTSPKGLSAFKTQCWCLGESSQDTGW